MSGHLYSAPYQEAVHWSFEGMTFKRPPRACAYCRNCWKRHQLRNMVVQAYYDDARFYCRPGFGCSKERS